MTLFEVFEEPFLERETGFNNRFAVWDSESIPKFDLFFKANSILQKLTPLRWMGSKSENDSWYP